MKEIPLTVDGQIDSWLVLVRDSVQEGQLLAKYRDDNGNLRDFTAPATGFIKSISLKKTERKIGVLVVCGHDVIFAGMCASCGADVSKLGTKAIAHAHPMIGVSLNEAQRIDTAKERKLLSNRKLSLVLDLDNTLIHATTDQILRQAPSMNRSDIFEFMLPPSPMRYFVKLRPHLREFFSQLEGLFELHIYTMGTRQYASKIAEILDLVNGKTLFPESRIVGRDDSVDERMKDLQHIFPCDDRMVLIVDDREDVWKNRANLIRIEPYQYFDAIREVNEVPFRGKRPPPPGASPSTTATLDTSPVVPKDTEQIAMDDAPSAGEENNNVPEEKKEEEEKVTSVDTETDPNQVTAMAVDGAKNENGAIVQHETDPQETIHEEDSFLLAVKDVLCEIHRIYYENENEEGKKRKAEPKRASDVKTILRRVRRRILNGCTLLFSGIFPTNVEASSTDVWKLALNLGAKCEREFTPNITHVIGATATEKVSRAANTPSVYLVSPNWLHATDKHWRRQDEMKFSVGPNYAVLMKDTPPPTIHQAPLEDIPDVITSTRTHEVENKRQKKEGEEEMKEIEEGEDGEVEDDDEDAQFLEKELFGSESEEEKEESQEGRGASDDE